MAETYVPEFLGTSTIAQKIRRTVHAVADTDVPVLILGESGTGKDLLARLIHRASKRRSAPFVQVDCPALPHDLIEAQLFGYSAGAYTGAQKASSGLLMTARDGTLFFNEIGDMPILAQPKLLRILDSNGTRHEFIPLGSTQTMTVDARIIAATNQNPADAMRLDIVYRIGGYPWHIPPLRERMEDLPILANAFLNKQGWTAAKEAIEMLSQHSWPGNVRELQNVLKTGKINASMEDRSEILPEDLHFDALGGGNPATSPLPFLNLDELKKLAFQQALLLTKGNKAAAARLLGVDVKTVFHKIKEYNL